MVERDGGRRRPAAASGRVAAWRWRFLVRLSAVIARALVVGVGEALSHREKEKTVFAPGFRPSRVRRFTQDGSESRHYTFVLHFLYLVVGAVRPVMGQRSGLAPTSNMHGGMRTCVSSFYHHWSDPAGVGRGRWVLRLPSQGSECLYTRRWTCPKAL